MNDGDGQDAADRLSAIVANSLDSQAKTNDLARQAYQSRTQFHRLFRNLVEETPAAMRRRLLLERAAHQLARTGISVTDVALDANYGSLEAFTRAFRKAFRISPSATGACGIRTFICRRPTTFTFFPLVQSPQVHPQKEKRTWIYSIVLQATTPGTRSACWNMQAR